MPIYDRPTKALMKEWAANHLKQGEVFAKSQPVAWFAKNYPRIKRATVEMHVEVMSVNNGRLRQHHASVKPGSGHDLFLKVEPGKFRLWDQSTDPAPVYEANDEVVELEDIEDEINGIDLRPHDATELREFAYEKDLQNYIARNLNSIEPGMHLFDDEGISGVEYPAGGRYIDILAEDANGKLVVIELKVSRGHDRVIGQIARYMAWVKANLECQAGVRGIIIANRISDDLRLASTEMNNVELLEYDIQFSVRKVA